MSPSQQSLSDWRDKLVWFAVTGFAAGAVAWATWMSTQIIKLLNHPDRDEVIRIAERESAKTKDSIESAKQVQHDMQTLLTSANESINNLRVEMAGLKALIERLDKERNMKKEPM